MKDSTSRVISLIFLLVLFSSSAFSKPNKSLLIKYQDYSCEQIEQELFIVDYKIFQHEIYLRQQDTSRQGACFTSILMFSTAPAHAELVQLKREYDALEHMADQKDCNFGVTPLEENKEK